MENSNFKQYKDRYRMIIRDVLAKAQGGELDEAAFPAYSHRNPLINLLFWQRLHTVMNYLENSAPYYSVMDFGCGSGVMLPFLASLSQEVVALDIDLRPIQMVQTHIAFPKNVKIHDANMVSLNSFISGSFDVIVALDVLEHVDNLNLALVDLCRLLKPGGKIIISGPTENIFYRVGRKFAGSEYSGDYHERGVGEIRRELEKITKVDQIATLYPVLPLFEIFVGIVS